MASNHITIQISYALPKQQWVQTLHLETGSTVADVLAQCKIWEPFTQLDFAQHKIGIFGKVVELTRIVQEGDRVEIYRPLTCDPKEIRRRRAQGQSKSVDKR